MTNDILVLTGASSSNLLSASIVRPFDRHFVLLSFASVVSMRFVSCHSLLTLSVLQGELATYIIAILVATKILLSKSHSSKPVKYNYLIMAVLLSSFGKLFIVSMMIWDYSSVYGYIINLFVLTSNITALRGIAHQRSSSILALPFLSLPRRKPFPHNAHRGCWLRGATALPAILLRLRSFHTIVSVVGRRCSPF